MKKGIKNGMKNEKKIIRIGGSLVGKLVKGKNALVCSGGKVYLTSRVTKIHEQTSEQIHFETAGAHYFLIVPEPSAVSSLFPAVSMAA